MSQPTLPFFKPPPDLLGKFRWFMTWFSVINVVAFAGLLVKNQGVGVDTSLGLVGLAVFGASLLAGFRQRDMTPVFDVAALLGIAAFSWAVRSVQFASTMMFAYLTAAQLYGGTLRALSRLGGVVVVLVIAIVAATGAAPIPRDASTLVGVAMASLFSHLLSRSLGRLQSSEARFRSLIQNSSDLLFLTDARGEIVWSSPPAEVFAGKPTPGARLPLSSGDAGRFLELLTRTAGMPAAVARGEFSLKRVDGMERACEVLVTNLLENSDVAGIVVNARDITERKAAEATLASQKEALRDARHEVEIAARIQTALLPQNRSVPGFELAAAMLPASEVGGDYYDIIPVEDGFYVGVGDVAGHGLQAGLVMLMTQSSISSIVSVNPKISPRDAVLHLNKVLVDNVRGRLGNKEHVTFTLLRITHDGRVSFAGAHEDLYVRRAATGKVEVLQTRGAWLGALEDIAQGMKEGSFTLEKGDVLLLHTDGITEARSPTKEEFGPERLTAMLTKMNGAPIQQACFKMMREVEEFGPERFDDRSLILARYVGVS